MVRGLREGDSFTLRNPHLQEQNKPNLALIGCYKFMCQNFPSNVVKNRTQKQLYFLTKTNYKNRSVKLVLFSLKCDWRKV